MTHLHIENKAQAGVATIAVEPRDRDPFGIVFSEPPARMEILA